MLPQEVDAFAVTCTLAMLIPRSTLPVVEANVTLAGPVSQISSEE
jgi:hypothetical protein